MNELPKEFVARLRQIVPDEYQAAVFAHMSEAQPACFRVNTLLAERESVFCELRNLGLEPEPIYGAPGFAVPAESRRILTDAEAAREGRIYIQSPSSMLPAPALDAQPGETILDLAAAPGGKTLHLAALMNNEGMLSAVEAIKGRFHHLRANLTRCGVSNCKTYLMDGRSVGRKCLERFDRILLDAPCSSEARIRADDPTSWKHWKPRKVRACAHKQIGLIRAAWQALKPGGTLMYCTCSFAPEENEAVVQALLEREENLSVLEIPGLPDAALPGLAEWNGKRFAESLARTRRVIPGRLWDGFYLALLHKEL